MSWYVKLFLLPQLLCKAPGSVYSEPERDMPDPSDPSIMESSRDLTGEETQFLVTHSTRTIHNVSFSFFGHPIRNLTTICIPVVRFMSEPGRGQLWLGKVNTIMHCL